jgi:hypothetical protein
MKAVRKPLLILGLVVGIVGLFCLTRSARPQEKTREPGQVYVDENGQSQIVGQPLLAEQVSLAGIIANRLKYDGKEVMTQGFLVYAFERMAIYVSREDALNGLSYNGVWLDGFNLRGPVEERRDILHKSHMHYVTVVGTFHKVGNAHLGHHFGGGLSDLIICGVERKVDDIPPLWAGYEQSKRGSDTKPRKSP